MRKIFALIFAVGFFLGCSSQANTSAPKTTSTSKNTNGQNSNAGVSSNLGQPANSEVVASDAPTDAPAGNARDRVARKRFIDVPSTGPPPPPQMLAAPENSEIATTMNRDGAVIETRVFKDHPQIEKVESTWLTPKQRNVRIFLKDGRVVETKTDRIDSLRIAPTGLLLEIAGIKVTKSPDSDARPRRSEQKTH